MSEHLQLDARSGFDAEKIAEKVKSFMDQNPGDVEVSVLLPDGAQDLVVVVPAYAGPDQIVSFFRYLEHAPSDELADEQVPLAEELEGELTESPIEETSHAVESESEAVQEAAEPEASKKKKK